MTDLGLADGAAGWDVTVVSESFTTGSEDVAAAIGRLQDQARQRHWDVVVGLTELPLHGLDGRHLLGETDPDQRTAVLSLPRRSRLYNASTLLTLLAGVVSCYVVLYAVNVTWAYFVLKPNAWRTTASARPLGEDLDANHGTGRVHGRRHHRSAAARGPSLQIVIGLRRSIA